MTGEKKGEEKLIKYSDQGRVYSTRKIINPLSLSSNINENLILTPGELVRVFHSE
jgi:hypothetical protein